MASLGRSANVSKTQAKRAESRLSGKTVPAATRAAQSVCVCIARPSRGLQPCCLLLLSYYPLRAPAPLLQLTKVMGNGQVTDEGVPGADGEALSCCPRRGMIRIRALKRQKPRTHAKQRRDLGVQ